MKSTTQTKLVCLKYFCSNVDVQSTNGILCSASFMAKAKRHNARSRNFVNSSVMGFEGVASVIEEHLVASIAFIQDDC